MDSDATFSGYDLLFVASLAANGALQLSVSSMLQYSCALWRPVTMCAQSLSTFKFILGVQSAAWGCVRLHHLLLSVAPPQHLQTMDNGFALGPATPCWPRGGKLYAISS
jgi:hypothetical protein